MKRICILSLMLLVITSFSMAQIGQISPILEIDSDARTLHLEAPYLYVGEVGAFKIFDVNNPAAPQFMGQIPTEYPVSAIAIHNNIALVGLESETEYNLVVVDIANKSAPQEIIRRQIGGNREWVTFIHNNGPIFYVGIWFMGIFSLELNDQNELVQPPNNFLPYPDLLVDAEKNGNYLYVSAEFADAGFDVVDISNPQNMQVIGHVEASPFTFVNAFDIDGTLLGAATAENGIFFYDVSNPAAPVQTGFIEVGAQNQISSIDLRLNFAYVGEYERQSGHVTEPTFPGEMYVLDYENVSNPRIVLRYEARKEILDVIAYAGYEYAIGDTKLFVFEHGPKDDIRPTSTPTVPTPTQTSTFTPTPTNTPPIAPTATPIGGVENTPTPIINTPTPLPGVTPTPQEQETPTPGASEPTPTPGGGEPTTPTPSQGTLQPIFSADFNGASLAEYQLEARLPFAGEFTLGTHLLSSIPTDNSFADATNGRGLMISVGPGQALTIFSGSPITAPAGSPMIFRANVRTTGSGVNIGQAVLDSTFDGTSAVNLYMDSGVFADQWKRIVLEFKAPSNAVHPILQIASSPGQEQPVFVYFDNMEIYAIPVGSSVPPELIGADGTAP